MRPATGDDLAEPRALARRTIDASYRSFLGEEAVDRFIGSGASDDHIAAHLGQDRVHCPQESREIVGFAIFDGAARPWRRDGHAGPAGTGLTVRPVSRHA